MFEDLLSAFQNFKYNRGRTLLSLLGIVIGVASVVITTSLGTSLEASMKSSFKDLNSCIISVYGNFNNQARMSNRAEVKLDDKFRSNMYKKIPEIKKIYYVSFLQATVSNKNLNAGNKEVRGIEYGWFDSQNMEFSYGGDFTLGDYADGLHKAIIGEKIAAGLFPEGDAVGKKITLYIRIGNNKTIPANFTVSGVLKNKQTLMGRASEYILIPLNIITSEFGQKGWQMIDIELYDANDVASAEVKIKEFGESYFNSKNIFEIFSIKTMIEEIQKSLNMVTIVLSGIAAISLFVGGIGIMNIMLVVVAERKKEIGIRKAIGASNYNILTLFLTESATLSLAGSVLGIIFGFLLCFVIVTKIFPSDAEIFFMPSISGAVISFVVSVFIGIFFGLYPAMQAAKLDPIKALEDI